MTSNASTVDGGALLDALLDSWRRNNLVLVNLLRALPDRALDLRASPGSPTVGALFMHMHCCRLVSVLENAPEFAAPVPEAEWQSERDRHRMAAMLDQSATVLAEAVRGRVLAGRPMDRAYDHPLLLLQHYVWHEGYHHGQIKLALKAAGQAFDDRAIGRVTWGVWMDKGAWAR